MPTHSYECDEPSLLRLLHLALALTAQVLDKLSEGEPLRGVHVDVVLVSNELIVHHLGTHTTGGVPAARYETSTGEVSRHFPP